MVTLDMEMPDTCCQCRFRVYDDREDRSRCVAYANFSFYEQPFVELPSYEKRSSFCPLKKIDIVDLNGYCDKGRKEN